MSDAAATTRELQADLDAALGREIEPGEEVVFLNFPDFANPGDSAIYLGARAALERAGARVMLVCAHNDYRRRLVARAVGPRGTIVLNGGGNFGDLYRKRGQQRVRRRVLRDFPDARLIQLPQTIYFEGEARARRFASLCAEHERLTIMVRDRPSAQRAAELGLETVLCPDGALGLGPLARPAAASQPVAWLLREDMERRTAVPGAGADARDWPVDEEQRRAPGSGRRLGRELRLARGLAGARDRGPAFVRLGLARALAGRYERIARVRTDLALEQLAAGEVVVSDRFHGHLLACMMGIPNVLLDNSYGKNRGLFETWTHRYEIARFAEDPNLAVDLARELAAA